MKDESSRSDGQTTGRIPTLGEQVEKSEKRRKRIRAGVIAAIVIVVVAVGGFVGHAIWTGDIAPADAAAKYDGFNYLPEDEVSAYIELYREQMGLADSSDEDWATFLAAYNLTPARLRYSTIEQLLKDKLVQKKADELGIVATEDEIDATVGTLRDSLGLGSDEILQQTLASHGQTEEGLREVYRQAILQRLVLTSEVAMPDPTDEQVKDYLKEFTPSLSNPTTKHSYCFRLVGLDEGGDRERISQAQRLREQFVSGEHTAEAFAEIVAQYSNDEDLVARRGANGWDVDANEYSSIYLDTVENLEVGEVSHVFVDNDSYAFIWVSDEYALPTDEARLAALDPDSVPSSLWQYLSDSAAYKLWEAAGQDYLNQLVEQAGVVYYPMPSTVSYNVDMSLADVQLEEVEE